MLNFTADPRDGYKHGSGCNTCCCEVINMKPGETNLLRINYTAWVVPLTGSGLTINTWFDVTKISPEPAAGGNNAPNVGLLAQYTGPANSPISGDLNDYVSDVDGGPLVFKTLGIYGPNHGQLTMPANGDGTFTYTPQTGFNGVDTFYYEVSDGFNKVVGYGAFVIGSGGAVTIPDKVSVTKSRKTVSADYNYMQVPIVVDPTARPGDIYRLNVRQEAIDCDGGQYYHVSCYDVKIGAC